MNIKLKICGMRESANIAEVAELQPAYMGFIFYERSPRNVGKNFEIPELPASIQRVGVFVNERLDTILSTVDRYRLDFVQLHGNETVELCQDLNRKGINIIKAFSIDQDFDFESVKPYAAYVSFFLFDTKGKYFGGNATAFDWTLLQKYNHPTPFFLSGGISPENVASIKEIKNPALHALDLNSGVESSPGVKDGVKIKNLKECISSL